MATGGLARGFLLKGGRQGIFTAGNAKLQASATRTSDSNEEREKTTNSTGSGPVHTQGPVYTTGASQTTGPVQTNGSLQTTGSVRNKAPVQTKEPFHPKGPLDTGRPCQTKGPIHINGPATATCQDQITGLVQTKEPVQTREPFHSKGPLNTKEPSHIGDQLHADGPVHRTRSQQDVKLLGELTGVNDSLRRVSSEPLGEPLVVKELSDGSTAVSDNLQQPFHSAQSAELNAGTVSEVALDLAANDRAEMVVSRGVVKEASGLPFGGLGSSVKTTPEKRAPDTECQSEQTLLKTVASQDCVQSTGSHLSEESVRTAEGIRNEESVRISESVRHKESVRSEGCGQSALENGGLPVQPSTAISALVANEAITVSGTGIIRTGSQGTPVGEQSSRGEAPGTAAPVSEAQGEPAGEAKVKRTVCGIEKVFEPVPRQSSADVRRAQATGGLFVRSPGSDIPPRTIPTVPLRKPEPLIASHSECSTSPEKNLSTSPDSPPPLPPEVVSFLLGWSPTGGGLGARKRKPAPNPFEPTPPGWNAELSLASAVAQDDAATRFLNLPTPAMQSVFGQLPVSSILNCQMVSKAWHDRFSEDPKLWATVDLSSDEKSRHVADDELLGKLLDRGRDRHGTSYLTSVDVSGCKNVTAGGLMAVMKHRGISRVRAHGSGAQLPVYFATWLADAGVDAHVDLHTGQRPPRLGLSDVAHHRSTWQDVIRLLSGSTRVVICGLDLRPSPLPFPSDLAVPFLQALYAAPNLETLRVGCAFRDRALLRDIAYVLDARRNGGWKGLEVLQLEGLRGDVADGTWEAVFGLLGGSDCQIKRLSVKDCHLGEAGSAALAAQLSENASVRELEVSDCALDAAAWKRLAEALQQNGSVSKLTVGGWGWKGVEAGTGPFEISDLDLIPDDDGVGFLGAALAQSTALEVTHITAWGGATVLDSTGRVADLSPGFAHLLKELGGLDPGTSRLKCIVVEYDDMCLADRGRSGALCVAAMLGFVVAAKGVRVVTASSAKMRPGIGYSSYGGVGNRLEVPRLSSPARETVSASACV